MAVPGPSGGAANAIIVRGLLALGVLLVVYASLFPFTGWRWPGAGDFGSIWSRFVTTFDLVANLIAYLPLGWVLALSRAGPRGAVLGCIALSVAMEAAQSFLPSRVVSLHDVFANGAGGAIGAWLAQSPVGHLTRTALVRLRHALFEPGDRTDWGLLLLLVWAIGQANPAIPFFEAGNIINTLTASRDANPYDPLFLFPQLAGIGLNVCGFALLVSLLARPPAGWLLCGFIAAGFTLKVVAAVLMLRASVLQEWLSPATILGLVAGLGLAVVLLPRSAFTRALLALLAAFAGALMSKLSGIYDDFGTILALFDWRHGQLGAFASLTRWLHELWPLAACAYLALLWLPAAWSGAQAGESNAGR